MGIIVPPDCVTVQTVEIDGVDESGPSVTIQIDQATAERLAQHRATRLASSLDVLAAEAKELAVPVMDALIAAGFGG